MSLIKKLISKGYTLAITSWENDADNYKTINKTVETYDEAKILHDMCMTLFKSENRQPSIGVGNSAGKDALYKICNYYETHKDSLTFEPFIDLKERLDTESDDSSEEDLIFDCFTEFAGELFGYSDFYDFRVCDSVVVTYSPEDIYLEEIKF